MPHPPPRPSTPNQVRIIGGLWRRRLLRFPPSADLRPTPDRVRETLFNWLGQDLSGLTTLDLFAGSGALSFEALSRGAALAVVVDAGALAVASLRDNADVLGATGLETHRADALAFLRRETRGFDLIFLDPPFRDEWLPRLWPLLPARLNPGGWLYVEQGQPLQPPPAWEIFRHQHAGQVHYHLLRRAAGNLGEEDIQRKQP
jgi:16S rRNA (guanine966-N2)-methyltransferase